MKTAIVAFEGVCIPDDRTKTLPEHLPVTGSLELLTLLSAGYNLIGYFDERTNAVDHVRDWLRLQNYPNVELVPGISINSVVLRSRQRGYDVQLVIDANPLHIALCVSMGVQSLLFVSPSYMRPEFRPDAESEIRPWDQMVGEIDKVREKRAKDARFEVVGE